MVLLSSCGGGSGSSSDIAPTAAITNPVVTVDKNIFPGLTWDVQTPESLNMTESGINIALDYAFASGRNTQSVVIVRHGIIVGERYANGKSKESLATSWSSGKSFASALVGIAMDQQLISSIDAPAEDYLAAWVNTGKSDITIRAILEMRSGLGEAAEGDTNISGIEGNINSKLGEKLFSNFGFATTHKKTSDNKKNILLPRYSISGSLNYIFNKDFNLNTN